MKFHLQSQEVTYAELTLPRKQGYTILRRVSPSSATSPPSSGLFSQPHCGEPGAGPYCIATPKGFGAGFVSYVDPRTKARDRKDQCPGYLRLFGVRSVF